MERERWSELSAAVSKVGAGWKDPGRYKHRTAAVARVHLWAASHDRPVSWACEPENWDARTRDGRSRPESLPDQSTMSRRTRGRHGKHFDAFLAAVGGEMNKGPLASCDPRPGARPMRLTKRMDGRALAVAAHSKDRDARWGRGAGQKSKGYKLHQVRSDLPMPEQWALTPLDVDERVVARRMIKRLTGAGYILRDGMYDASELYRDRLQIERDLGNMELRRRHEQPAAVGAARLARAQLGPRQAPGQRRPHPLPAAAATQSCIMFLSKGERE